MIYGFLKNDDLLYFFVDILLVLKALAELRHNKVSIVPGRVVSKVLRQTVRRKFDFVCREEVEVLDDPLSEIERFQLQNLRKYKITFILFFIIFLFFVFFIFFFVLLLLLYHPPELKLFLV